jgi:hypothetical protein
MNPTHNGNLSEALFQQNIKIKEEAGEMLHQRGLLDILNSYGKPYVSGSYALDLMTWRDLDIYVATELIDGQRFFQLGNELCKALSPARMHFRNELISKTDGLPNGLYWGIYLGNEREGAWKIDVWAVCDEECDRLIKYAGAIREKLNVDSRDVILSIKSQCWQDPEYRRNYSSTDIYDAVLTHGVRDLQGFWQYLES